MYTIIQRKNKKIPVMLVFLNWEDYDRYRAGEVIGTRYDSTAKVEITAFGEKDINMVGKIPEWYKVKKLGNDDYCIDFHISEASHSLIHVHHIEHKDQRGNTIMKISIHWPQHGDYHGYHERIRFANYYVSKKVA